MTGQDPPVCADQQRVMIGMWHMRVCVCVLAALAVMWLHSGQCADSLVFDGRPSSHQSMRKNNRDIKRLQAVA